MHERHNWGDGGGVDADGKSLNSISHLEILPCRRGESTKIGVCRGSTLMTARHGMAGGAD